MGFCFNELGKVGKHLNGTSGKAGGGQKAGNLGEWGQGTGAKQGHVAGHAAPVKRKVGPLNIGPASGSIRADYRTKLSNAATPTMLVEAKRSPSS